MPILYNIKLSQTGQPVYVDRIVYKDREVQKEVLQEVHVEVEVEKINYVNQLVEKEGASVPVC